MKTKPVHIHLKENAVPKAVHVPIPVPLNLSKEFGEKLEPVCCVGRDLEGRSRRASYLVQSDAHNETPR